MKRCLSLEEISQVKDTLKQVDYYQTCDPFTDFYSTGEEHWFYVDEKGNSYEYVKGFGYSAMYILED